MGARCRIRTVSDEDDNVYFHPAVIKQVLNDLQEMARDEKRKTATCSVCVERFVPVERDGVTKCPKCGHEWEEGDQD